MKRYHHDGTACNHRAHGCGQLRPSPLAVTVAAVLVAARVILRRLAPASGFAGAGNEADADLTRRAYPGHRQPVVTRASGLGSLRGRAVRRTWLGVKWRGTGAGGRRAMRRRVA
jgi:hypothetical protein